MKFTAVYQVRWLRILKRGSLGALLLSALTGLASDWKPGERPNPEAILREAEADARAGRYEDALAKHVWFHENALKYAPAMYGVRLSFALLSRKTLGASYPPALRKLKTVRDEAANDVRASRDPRHSFHDFAAINRELEEETRTEELFLWLDANDPKTASAVFDIAQPSLVRARQYQVCGKYLDPDRSFERMLELFRETKKIAVDSQYPGEMQDFADKSFSNGAATLVALLVANGRQVDAERVADQARKALDTREFREQIEEALKGVVPPPWP